VEGALITTEAKRITKVEAAEREATEWAAHWAAVMDKALAYRRDVDRREASRRAQTEHRRTLRRQDSAIHAAMAAIDGAGPASNGNGADLQGDGGDGYVATTSHAGMAATAKTNQWPVG
jgi:hypothetical protein